MKMNRQKQTQTYQNAIGDTICSILHAVYVEEREQFQKEAAKRQITVEQMSAAAITGMLRQTVGR
jgi:hypothetical protein